MFFFLATKIFVYFPVKKQLCILERALNVESKILTFIPPDSVTLGKLADHSEP